MATPHRHKITGRTRDAVLPLGIDRIPGLAVMAVGLLALCTAIALSRTPLPSAETTTSITVSAGETLWSIAKRHPVTGLDTAQTVELIAQINGLRSATISPGESLDVPVPSAPESGLAMR